MPYFILHDERNQDHVFVSLDTEHVRKIPAALVYRSADLLAALECAEQTCRNLVDGGFVSGDATLILINEAGNLRGAIALARKEG
jgi:hypothetical protein